MKSSESKRKLNTEKICREYYESQIFGGQVDDAASALLFFVDSSLFLEHADSSFKGMDYVIFSKEIKAINIELFGLELLSYNNKLCKEGSITDSISPESFLSEEIVFTERYLKDIGIGEIWGKMRFCNELINETVVEGAMFDDWGRLRDIPPMYKEEDKYDVREKSILTTVKSVDDLFSKPVKDSEVRERLRHRFMFVPCNMTKITVLSQKLSLKLPEKLGCNPNQVGLFALQKLIVGLHDNVMNYLDAVRDYGSYEAAIKAMDDIRLKMIRYLAREQQQK